MYEDRVTDEERIELQRRYGGQCVARRGTEVIASSESFDELIDALLAMNRSWDDLIIEYFDPPDVVSVY